MTGMMVSQGQVLSCRRGTSDHRRMIHPTLKCVRLLFPSHDFAQRDGKYRIGVLPPIVYRFHDFIEILKSGPSHLDCTLPYEWPVISTSIMSVKALICSGVLHTSLVERRFAEELVVGVVELEHGKDSLTKCRVGAAHLFYERHAWR